MPPKGAEHQEAAKPAENVQGGRQAVSFTDVETSKPPQRSAESSTESGTMRTRDQKGDNTNDPTETFKRSQELARQPYEVPKSARDQQRALSKDTEATSSTGIGKERTVTTATGEQIKGISIRNSETGKQQLLAPNEKGEYDQYNVNKRSIQKLDGEGKPVGDKIPLQPKWQDPNRPNRAEEAAKGMEGNGKQRDLPAWAKQDETRGNWKPEHGRNNDKPEGAKPEIGKPQEGGGKPQDVVKPGDGGGVKPADGGGVKPSDGGNKPADGGSKSNNEGGKWNPHDNPHNKDSNNRPGGNNDNPQGYRPSQDFKKDGEGGGRKDWDGPKNRDNDGGKHRDSNDGGNNWRNNNENRGPKGDDQPWRPGKNNDGPNKDGGDPRGSRGEGDNYRGGRQQQGQQDQQDRGWSHQQRQEWQQQRQQEIAAQRAARQDSTPQQRPEFNPNKEFGRPENPHGRPDLAGRVDFNGRDGRPDIGKGDQAGRDGRNFNLTDALKPDAHGMRLIDRAMLAEASRELGRGVKGDFTGLAGRGELGSGKGDFAALRNMDAASLKQFLDGQKSTLQGNFLQTLRTNGTDQLGPLSRALSGQNGDLVGRLAGRPGMEGDRFALNLGKSLDGRNVVDGRMDANAARSLTPAMMAEIAGKQMISRLMDAMTRHDVDRVPTAEQSRLLIRDLMQNQKADQSGNHLDLLSATQRNLNQRNIDAASNNNQFTVKNLDAAQQLTLRTKDQQENQTKDQQKAELVRTLDNNASKAQTNQLTQNLTNRTIDSANATQNINQQKQEQVRNGRDVEDHTAQQTNTARIQQQVFVQTDKAAQNDNKIEPTQTKNNDNKIDDKKSEDERKIKEKNEDTKEAQMAALLAIQKLKDLKEKEKEKEKENIKDKSNKDPQQKTRIKYRIKKNDTLASIAERFLGNADHAPAIFHINRTIIPVTTYNGSTFANPPVDIMIWIPTDDDVDMFKDSGVMKNYQHIGFAGATYASAEDELAARFGRRWFGPSAEEKAVVEEASALHTSAMDPDRAARRANIEKQIGSFASQSSIVNGRLRYTVRLGETLKSIALKHPLLKDVDMWKLIAKANDLPTDLDEKGCPVAVLKRGMTLLMPTHQEAEEFRANKPQRKITGQYQIPNMPSISIESIMR